MNSDNIIKHDNLDERRQLYQMMGFRGMTPWKRLEFLRWCRDQCPRFVPVEVVPAYGTYGVHDAVMDFAMLTLQYGLKASVALKELERRVKRL